MGVALVQSFQQGNSNPARLQQGISRQPEKNGGADSKKQNRLHRLLMILVALQKMQPVTNRPIGKEAGSVAEVLSNYYSGLTNELGEMSAAALDAFESMQGVDDSRTNHAQDDIASLKQQLAAAQNEAQKLAETISADPTGIDSWLKNTGSQCRLYKDAVSGAENRL